MIDQRPPPQDLDAERALLGSMMLDREAIGEAIPIIGPGDERWLYLPSHRAIFGELLAMYDANVPIDIVTLRNRLELAEKLNDAGGVEYVAGCAERVPTAVNVAHYARIVRDKGLLRDLILATCEIQDDAYAAHDDSGAILDSAEQRLFAVTEQRVMGDAVPAGAEAARLLDELDRAAGGEPTGLNSGYRHLDDLTTGFQPGDLIIVAARPSMGKTALGLNMAVNFAMDADVPVLVLSMEMSRQQLAMRMLCSVAGVDAQKLRRRIHNDHDVERLREAQQRIAQAATILIDDTPSQTATDVRAKARRCKSRHGIGAVVVDYLQLMHARGKTGREQEIAYISRSLKALGRELGIPIIAMAQLNRKVEESGDKRPSLSHLRESGAIEQDADVVLLLHRPGYYKWDDPKIQNEALLIVAKQRNGPTGDIPLVFDHDTTTFRNKAHDQDAEADAGVAAYAREAAELF